MSRCLALAALVLLPASIAAQPLQVVLPDSVVVTASREAERARDTGRRVTVLTAADIARLPVASFDELLRTAAGVEVLSRGGFGVQSDLTVRGSTFGGVLVLVDGVRFNDPMTGHFLSDFPLPLAEIARIEVLRGPASALYGPDAVGGVVQVFTYTGMGTARSEAAARVEGGTHALVQLDAAARYAANRTTVGAGGAYNRSDGHPIANADGSEGPLRAGFERGAATAALYHRTGRGHVFARAAFDARAFDAVRFYTPFPSDTAREATETYWAQAGYQQATARTRYTFSLGARVHEDRYTYNPSTPTNVHVSRQATAGAALHHTLRGGTVATAGVSGALRDIDSNNLGTHADASAGAFAGLRLPLLPGLTVHGSLRLDYDAAYGTEVTPQLAAAFTRQALTLRAAAGRSVRAPSYVERYFNTELAQPRGRDLGNPNLDAERAWTGEAGADLYLAGLSLHGTAFHRDVENLIDFVRLSPADSVFRARNLLRVRTTGVEIEARAVQDLGAARLRLDLGYTFLDARLRGIPAGAQAKYALTNARHLVQASAALDAGSATLGVQAMAKEPVVGDPYQLYNLCVAYALPVQALRLHVTGEVRNVFDTRYTEVFAAMPGRWFVFGVWAAF